MTVTFCFNLTTRLCLVIDVSTVQTCAVLLQEDVDAADDDPLYYYSYKFNKH